MTTRIVVADQADARFYEVDAADGTLREVGKMTHPAARQHDRDLKSDRPGRVFDHAPDSAHRRGSVARHATGGENTPRRHEAEVFASHIAQSLQAARQAGAFDRLVLIAGPQVLGLLRAALSKQLTDIVTLEVVKDLVHERESVLRSYLPADIVAPAGLRQTHGRA